VAKNWALTCALCLMDRMILPTQQIAIEPEEQQHWYLALDAVEWKSGAPLVACVVDGTRP